MWRYILARRALRRRIVEYAPDILHANDLPTLQILADASRGTGIPLVCHHRFGYDADAIDWFNKYPADLNIFISRGFYQQMTETSPRLARQPHVIIHDGLPLAEPADDSQRRGARLRLRLPPDRTMVTFTGQIIPRKGVAELLHAWSLLPVEVRNSSELLIVGDDLAAGGAYLREMRTLAEELRIKPHFAGFQQPIDPYLLASDLVVLPSLAEPLGLTIMEAMAFGLPTIGSDVGGIPEMIEHEKTGLLVPPGDLRTLAAALERLISDSAMRSELGRAARQRCKAMFSIESHVRAVVDAYRQCMQMDRRRCAA
jgi:glycosyltransferase involved in cell wall biosynthesis